MLSDPLEVKLAQLLNTGLAEPRLRLETRALAAMAGVRPRRHPRLVTIIVVTLILLVLAAAGYAAARFFLEAKLQFSDVANRPDREDSETRLLTGQTVGQNLEWGTPDKPVISRRGRNVLSPDGKKRAFQRGNALLGFGMRHCDVYLDVHLADADGSHERNLTKEAGLGGINCEPSWSPDGTMIYFAHVDPVEGKTPCQAHFEPWVMRADGSGAHRLTPKGSPGYSPGNVQWSPDSTRLLSCWQTDVYDYDEFVITAFTVDVRTGKIQIIPNVGMWPRYSPDGSQIVSLGCEPDTVKGENGYWNQLLLTDADGSNPRVLVQQFIADATARARGLGEKDRETTGYPWIAQFRSRTGPLPAAWSPKGNQIAFLAALPYDAKLQGVDPQIEVWVYDLRSKHAIRITHDNIAQTGVRWK
jgi:Tol biopolymer transport system component